MENDKLYGFKCKISRLLYWCYTLLFSWPPPEVLLRDWQWGKLYFHVKTWAFLTVDVLLVCVLSVCMLMLWSILCMPQPGTPSLTLPEIHKRLTTKAIEHTTKNGQWLCQNLQLQLQENLVVEVGWDGLHQSLLHFTPHFTHLCTVFGKVFSIIWEIAEQKQI